jgi:3-deoxy-D-manno-oct-2-ulosonic acid (Kdo) hydroxylase
MELVIVPSGRPASSTYLEALEKGNILMFPQTPFEIAAEDQQTLLGAGQADGNFHKNIAFRPASGKLTGLGKAAPGEAGRVHRALANYSRQAIELLSGVLAPYQPHWKTDYASFRSIEEEGRALPLKKRNDLLHTDAFPTRPTNGGLILRIFSNINPEKSRDWLTSSPFAALASQFAQDAGLPQIAANANSTKRKFLHAARSLGLPVVDRSPYDEFMLGFHDYLKMNADYQRDSPKYRFHFPPGATWIVFTDVVPHAVLAGRYALEQTMIIARHSLQDPGRAPASILENLSGRKLTYPL